MDGCSIQLSNCRCGGGTTFLRCKDEKIAAEIVKLLIEGLIGYDYDDISIVPPIGSGRDHHNWTLSHDGKWVQQY